MYQQRERDSNSNINRDMVLLVMLVVMIGYVLINFGVSNGLEPRIMGQQLGLRFVWIFVSLIVWGWILGPVGMLLAVPLTMTLRIALEKHPKTIWIANILVPENLIKSTGEPEEETQEKPVS